MVNCGIKSFYLQLFWAIAFSKVFIGIDIRDVIAYKQAKAIAYTVKIISDKLLHVTGTFGGFDTLLLQAK